MANEQTIKIEDFTPGIYSNSNFNSTATTGVGSAPVGAAQVADTFRCIGLPTGGLGPLPRRVGNHTPTWPGVGATAHIVGLHVTPVLRTVNTTDQSGDAVYLMYDVDTNPRRNYCYVLNPYTGVFTQLNWGTTAWPPNAGAATGFITLTTANTDPPVGVSMTSGMVYHTGAGTLKTVVAWSSPVAAQIGGSTPRFWIHGTDGTNFRAQFFGSGSLLVRASEVFWHGQRFVIIKNYGDGVASIVAGIQGLYAGLDYTLPYAATGWPTAPASSGNMNFLILDRAQAFGSGGSISTGELILIGVEHGTSLQISGDLDNPSVSILRGVHPTGRFISPGISTKLGLLYATEYDGIWVWGGGRQSEKVSTQLRDDFYYRTTPTSFNYPTLAANYTSLGESIHPCAWGDYVMYPNNYLFDTETGSWWRLDDPSFKNYQIFASSTPRYVWGAVDSVTAATVGSALGQYDNSLAALSYSWKSQPLPNPYPEKMVEIYDVEVEATVSTAGVNQTVTVYLLDELGATVSQAFTFNSPVDVKPQRRRLSLFSRGFNPVVMVYSDGGANPAPVVNSITLFVREGTPTATS